MRIFKIIFFFNKILLYNKKLPDGIVDLFYFILNIIYLLLLIIIILFFIFSSIFLFVSIRIY